MNRVLAGSVLLFSVACGHRSEGIRPVPPDETIPSVWTDASSSARGADSSSQRVSDRGPNPSLEAGSVASPSNETLRVACGERSPYTDPQGGVWAADNSYVGGTGTSATTPVPIAGTDTPELYNSERYGTDGAGNPAAFSYVFRVAPGDYVVTLKFAETFVTGAGQRLFDVSLNGNGALRNFDIYAAAGGENTAVDRSFPVRVGAAGQISIDFVPGPIQKPKVNAILLRSAAGTTDAAALASDAQDPCAGQSCSGQGTCSVSNGVGSCACNAGYTASGLTCVGASATSTSNFHVSQGALIDPDGYAWAGKGINVYDNQMSAVSSSSMAAPLLTAFPGLRIVRVPCYGYNVPSYYQTFIAQLTAQKIVVELENHMGPDGQNAGGGTYTGAGLVAETSWYASLAAAYVDNPYVWFGTLNEPSQTDGGTSDIVAEHVATYNAIRGAGNNNIVMLVQAGGWTSTGFTQASYSNMTNVAWDTHFYPWVAGYNADLGANQTALMNQIANAQAITSADGIVPVVIGEYGNSSSGMPNDTGGTQTVAVVGSSGRPSMAWEWAPGAPADALTDGNGNLTSPYGAQVRDLIAAQ